MFLHLILGLLRDGKPHHGYELISDFRQRSGSQTNPGNFYRELGKLAVEKLVEPGENPPDADPRRLPYRITDRGRQRFDDWLLSPESQDEDFASWMLFLDRVPPDTLARMLDRLQEQLWLHSKSLTRARSDALAHVSRNGGGRHYHPAPLLLLRRLKQTTAELDFIQELRREIAHLLDDSGWTGGNGGGDDDDGDEGSSE